MANPWGYGPKTFEVEGGVDTLIGLRVPHRGTLQRINLEQVGGADDGHFQIFDSEAAAKVIAEDVAGESASLISSESSSGLTGADPAVSDITQGPVAITAGRYQSGDLNIQYRNRDGSFSVPVRKLWMVLNSQGGGIKQFALSMVIETPNLG